MLEQRFRATIVWLILNGKTEEALKLLTKHYGVSTPKLEVGIPKGLKKRAFGSYSTKSRTISVLNSDILKDPFVILHEFYHHMRTTVDAKHKGTEKYADDFAKDFIQAFKSMASEGSGNN